MHIYCLNICVFAVIIEMFYILGHKMNYLMQMLKEKDTVLWLCMDKQQLQPQFFAFRWLTLLLSQEFPLPGIFRFILHLTLFYLFPLVLFIIYRTAQVSCDINTHLTTPHITQHITTPHITDASRYLSVAFVTLKYRQTDRSLYCFILHRVRRMVTQW